MKTVLLWAAVLLPLAAQAAPLAPPRADYVLERGRMTLGSAQFTLAPIEGAECYRYEYRATPQGLARLFIGEVRETSEFCMEDGALRSRGFVYARADKPEEDFSLSFDWARGVARSSRGPELALTAESIDRLALQLAVQRWVAARKGEPGAEEFAITKVEDDRAKTYRFVIRARETVQVPAGRFETVRVERVDDASRSTRSWLAPALGYQPVKLEQLKDGEVQVRMLLKP